MSSKEGIKRNLHRRRLLSSEIATYLIDDPHCLDGDTQKEEAYRIALEYFSQKQKKSKSTGGETFFNNAGTILLQILIDCYEDEKGKSKEEYAKKIAYHVLQTGKASLQLIPDETKDSAFQIISNYLEEQMRS